MKTYQIEQCFYVILGILSLAFGLLDWCTTKIITRYEILFETVKDTYFNDEMHAGAIMIGAIFIFLWFVNREGNK